MSFLSLHGRWRPGSDKMALNAPSRRCTCPQAPRVRAPEGGRHHAVTRVSLDRADLRDPAAWRYTPTPSPGSSGILTRCRTGDNSTHSADSTIPATAMTMVGRIPIVSPNEPRTNCAECRHANVEAAHGRVHSPKQMVGGQRLTQGGVEQPRTSSPPPSRVMRDPICETVCPVHSLTKSGWRSSVMVCCPPVLRPLALGPAEHAGRGAATRQLR